MVVCPPNLMDPHLRRFMRNLSLGCWGLVAGVVLSAGEVCVPVWGT